ncbi:MAG: cell envelope protein SmpA [Marinosulfonomonas sp.]|nr:MAG: cell envelope protein SmpA [Marinosulfonomonas sp.]PHQ96628.1 MAG: cell envelope protein SmpA [Marinosulfonomonas sp.]
MGKLAVGIRTLVALTAILAVSSCAAQYRNHGYVPKDDELANIIVGADTRETVASVIGNPTSSGILEDSGWYYVESRFRLFGFQAPKEIERQVLAISFDGAGRVANIERFGLEDGQVVTLSRRVTETSTVRVSFLRQLLGNIGGAGGSVFN